jgi:Flp pilus assembly pilin Flp
VPRHHHGPPRRSTIGPRVPDAFVRDESAQDLIEYALLGAMIALLLMGILPHVTDSVNARYERVGSTLRTITYDCADSAKPRRVDEPPSNCD